MWHGVHTAAAAAACVPAAQISHRALPASGADPASHVTQPPERSPAAATPFDGHGSHALSSSFANVPAPHGSQRLRSVLLT